MAVVLTWFSQDLQKAVKVNHIDGNLFTHNGNGNSIGVRVYNDGEPVTLTGTVSGYVITSDGSTVPCVGARSGNEATITIPPAAYQPGNAFITIFLTDGSTVTTLCAAQTTVLQARTGSQVSPGSVVTDWTQTINAAMQSVENAAENLGGIIATPYASLTYPVPLGKYTYYNNGLYRCISPIETSEEFTAAHWTQVKLGDDVSDLKSAIIKNSDTELNLNTIESAYVNASGRIISGGVAVLTIANVGGTNVIKVKEGTVYAWYTNVPQIGSTSIDGTRTVQTLSNTELQVPSSARYVVIQGTASTKIFSLLQAEENEVKEVLPDLISGVKTYTIAPEFEYNGSYVDNHNDIQIDSRFDVTEYINIKPYKQVTIPVYIAGSTNACIVFVSDDRSTVVKAISGAEVTETPLTIQVPEGAGWLRASQRSSRTTGYAVTCLFEYIEKTFEMTSAKNPTEEQPLDNIIHDGGLCKIFEKMGVVGDSLSSGAMSPPSDGEVPEDQEDTTDYFWYSWIQCMSRYCGNTAYNFSMGGLSARGLRYGQSNPNVLDIYTRLMGTEQKCKAYFVALGHNDRNYANTHPEYVVGTTADCDLSNPSNNADTYCGNLAWVISQIKTTQPRAKIFLITMKNADAFSAYNIAIRSMVALFNTFYGNTDVYLIDMEGVPLEVSWEYTNGHGNAMGYLNYSWQISSYVDYIIRKNLSDFKLVQFIGTPYLP